MDKGVTATVAICVRPVEARDRAGILNVVRAAFDGDSEARLVELLWAQDGIEFELAAVESDDIVGHCAFSRVVTAPAVNGEVLGLAPVSVLPSHQKKGIGAALIHTGLDEAKARGVAAVVLVGHPAYYPRFGFLPASAKNVRWDGHDVGDAFQLVDFAGVFDGAPTTVGYHPAFSAF